MRTIHARLLLIFIGFMLVFSSIPVFVQTTSAAGWDASFHYLKNCYVSNKYLKYQMMIVVGKTAGSGNNVTCDGHCADDFSDIRFVSQNTTPIPYWIQNYTSGIEATIWVNNSANESCFQLYYGKASTASTSDGNSTFDLFDDFNGTSRNTHKWSLTGTPTLAYSGSVMTISASTNNNYISSSSELRSASFIKGYAVTSKRHDYAANRYINWGFGMTNVGTTHCVNLFSNGASAYDLGWSDGTFAQASVNHNNIVVWHIETIARSFAASSSVYCWLNYTTTFYTGGSTSHIPTDSFTIGIGETYGGAAEKADVDWIFVHKFRTHAQSCSPIWKSFGTEITNNMITQSNPSPSNGATLIYKHPILGITVVESLGHTMAVTFRSNSTGSWSDLGSNVSVNDGTYRQHFYNAVIYLHKYWWSVNATDTTVYHVWSNATYSFTTRPDFPPQITVTSPVNDTINGASISGFYISQPPITIVLNDPEGDRMNVSIKTNQTGSYVKFAGHSNVNNGTYTNSSLYFTVTNTTWYVSFNLTDNHSNWHNFSVHFYLLPCPLIQINNLTSNVMHGYTEIYDPTIGWTVDLYYSNYPIMMHNDTHNVTRSHTLHWTPNGFDVFDNDTGNTTALHVTNSTDHCVPLHYISFNSTGWWFTDADFCHAGYVNYNTNCTGTTYFSFTPGYGYTLVNSYTGVTTPLHFHNATHNVTNGVTIKFNSTGWWAFNNDSGNLTPVHLIQKLINCYGNLTYIQNATGYWITGWYTGNASGNGTGNYSITIHLISVDGLTFNVTWSGGYNSTNTNITVPVTHNMSIVGAITVLGMIVAYDIDQFSIIVLIVLMVVLTILGYVLPNSKTRAAFLMFGGIFSILCMISVAAYFNGIWYLTSPAFLLVSMILFKDMLLNVLYGTVEDRQRKKK
jgi:hypothetical protein